MTEKKKHRAKMIEDDKQQPNRRTKLFTLQRNLINETTKVVDWHSPASKLFGQICFDTLQFGLLRFSFYSSSSSLLYLFPFLCPPFIHVTISNTINHYENQPNCLLKTLIESNSIRNLKEYRNAENTICTLFFFFCKRSLVQYFYLVLQDQYIFPLFFFFSSFFCECERVWM